MKLIAIRTIAPISVTPDAPVIPDWGRAGSGSGSTGGESSLRLLEKEEEIEVLQNILNVIEDYTLMNSIFTRHVDNDSKVKVLIGNELGINAFGQCSVVFAYFNLHRSEKGIISVIGPSRMNYSKVIPAIRYVVECLNEAVNGW